MPSAVKYIPPTEPARNSFQGEVQNERQKRRDKYRTALDYYLGDQPSQLKTDPDSTDPDDNTIINMVQMTADRTVSFLFPEMPCFETDPEAIEETPEEEWLEDFLAKNGGLQTLIKWGLRGFLAGHSFIRIKPDSDKKRKNPGSVPHMVVLDPTAVSVYWKADDVAEVIWYELRYLVGDVVYIQDFVHNEELERWEVYTYRSSNTVDNNNPFPGQPTNWGDASTIALDMLSFGDATHSMFVQEGGVAIHNSDIPPIIEVAHLPHPDDYYGLGEFTQKDLQDTINRIMSLRNRITRQTSEPVDALTGADIDDVERVEGLVTISNPAARITRLELKGDLLAITTVLEELKATYLAIARVVLLKGEAKDLQRVTNASVRTLFLDALSKNAILQSAYGAALIKLAKVALEMAYEAGQIAADPASIVLKLKWPTPLPVDDTEVANQNAIMVNLGARSKRTAATKMGDDWKFESSAMDAETQLANEKALQQGEIAAQNAAKMAEAMPAPTMGAAPAGKPPGKPGAAPVKPGQKPAQPPPKK